MIGRYHLIGSAREQPANAGIIYLDGSAEYGFRPDVDLELSHWIPNRTPAAFKADSSTAIAMRFVADPPAGAWDLAVNNHRDVDGILSLYTVVHSKLALAHRATLVAAAEIGDFWAWGDEPAQILFQGLTLLIAKMDFAGADLGDLHDAAFAMIPGLLTAPRDSDPAIQAGLDALAAAAQRVTSGQIERRLLHERFVHYHIPQALAVPERVRALHVPGFNAALSDAALLPPQVRNREDRQRVQLVSCQVEGGATFDLHYPGYMWAETPSSWRAPGFSFAGSTNAHYYGHAGLDQAVAHLALREPARGRWVLAKRLTPFEALEGRGYPVVLSFLDAQNRPTPSATAPDKVASLLASAFV